MNATFRLDRTCLKTGLWCLPLFLSQVGCWIWLANCDPKLADRRVLLLLLFGGFWLVMVCGALYLIVAYFRARLIVEGARMIEVGVFLRREVHLDDVTALRWIPGGSGSVKLLTQSGGLCLRLGQYEQDAREPLIRHIREQVAPALQTDWNLFVYKVLDPMLRPKRTVPGPDEYLFTRRHWNRVFIPTLILTIPIVALRWYFDHNPMLFAFFPALVGLWLLMRYWTPRDGQVFPKRSDPIAAAFTRFLFGIMLLWLLLFAAMCALKAVWPFTTVTLGAFSAIFFAIVLVVAHKTDKAHRKADRAAAEALAAERGGSK